MKSVLPITVDATWDEQAMVWVATSLDIHGLALEAGTIDLLKQKVLIAIADLTELNGDASERTVRFHSPR